MVMSLPVIARVLRSYSAATKLWAVARMVILPPFTIILPLQLNPLEPSPAHLMAISPPFINRSFSHLKPPAVVVSLLNVPSTMPVILPPSMVMLPLLLIIFEPLPLTSPCMLPPLSVRLPLVLKIELFSSLVRAFM